MFDIILRIIVGAGLGSFLALVFNDGLWMVSAIIFTTVAPTVEKRLRYGK